MFAYCGNNPISRIDCGGNFWDTILDVVSLCSSISDVIDDPSDPLAWLGLAGDIIDVAVPLVCGAGEAIRAASKMYDIYDDCKDAAKAVENVAETAQTLHRPYIRKSTREAVEKVAKKDANGLFLDANTGEVIVGKYDLGHKYGHEFWRERDRAQALGWSQKEFNDYMNNPDFYQIEAPHNNRSHKFEKR